MANTLFMILGIDAIREDYAELHSTGHTQKQHRSETDKVLDWLLKQVETKGFDSEGI